uniref:Uncharacterized protein n=1 Tax=Leptospirillum sp. Group II '5-way CG' TaxID=419541 RepID=B6AQ60_9BACT|nr:MAG: Conserved hypothetical protein [Leptospirillum sp. Group II '5-way CG']
MMGFLDEVFDGMSGASGVTYPDGINAKPSNTNDVCIDVCIYDASRDHAPHTPHTPHPITPEKYQTSNTEANLREIPVPCSPRIQKITRATNPDELAGAMSDYIPGQLSDSELIELTKAYELKMAEFLPDEWPETPIEQPTLPEASEPCLSGQNQGHPGRITPHLAWDGQEVVILPRCGVCQHFTRDSVNPASGLGTCQVFLLPDGKRQIGRYPMQDPKTETCFERESPR